LDTLQEEMIKLGVKRGAPRGLLTVRLVFNPSKKTDKKLWNMLEEQSKQNGLDITEYVKTILAKHIGHA
jgi:ParB family transcriptional regulator, chromosome partitioning protein